MSHVYIVISQTGTVLSRLLKCITRAEYNHASLSLSPDLLTMYSFGRRHAYNPFWGGFVEESPHHGTFKRFSETEVVVLALPVTPPLRQALECRLAYIQERRRRFHYNYLGVALAGFNIHWQRQRYYYCSEFVRDMLLEIQDVARLDPIIHPVDFLTLPQARVVYRGKLRDYTPACCAEAIGG